MTWTLVLVADVFKADEAQCFYANGAKRLCDDSIANWILEERPSWKALPGWLRAHGFRDERFTAKLRALSEDNVVCLRDGRDGYTILREMQMGEV